MLVCNRWTWEATHSDRLRAAGLWLGKRADLWWLLGIHLSYLPIRRKGATLEVQRAGEAYLVRLETGEEIITSLKQFADAYRITFAAIRATGILRRVTLGRYDDQAKSLRAKELDESLELLSLAGDIAQGQDGERIVRALVTVGRSDYTTLGGHVMEAVVGATAEVIVEPLPTAVRRRQDPATGLELWDLSSLETLSA